MKILFVEDDPEWARLVVDQVLSFEPDAEFAVTENRDHALGALAHNTYDLIICDLKIPADESTPEPDEAHGVAVLDAVEELAAGTRVVVLSGYGTLPLLQPYLGRAAAEDYFGTGTRWVMRDHVVKSEVDKFLDEIQTFVAELRDVELVELRGAIEAELGEDDIRILRIFGKRNSGSIVDVRPLDGGRSGARTLRIDVRNDADARTCLAVAKIGDRSDIFDEQRRYYRHIAPLLPLGTYTPHSGAVEHGAGNHAGVFYALADGFDRSLFDLLRADPREAAGTVRRLHGNLEAWHQNPTAQSMTLRELRREHAPDELLAVPEIAVLDVGAQENRLVYVRRANGHADLHGANVLVDQGGQPVLIDFGRASECMNPFDPVTLELSAVCHPDAGLEFEGWPSQEQWRRWFDLDAFVADSPIEDYVRACREWAAGVARADRELLACAYVYLLRQLQYETVPRDVIAVALSGLLEQLAIR